MHPNSLKCLKISYRVFKSLRAVALGKTINSLSVFCLVSFINLVPWIAAAAAATKLLQSCPTLCDPIDGSPPGSPVPGTLQARTLEWVAISFSNAWKWKVKVKSLSHVWLFVTPWTVAYQAPLSMGFSRQEYWSGLPFPSPEQRKPKTKWKNILQTGKNYLQTMLPIRHPYPKYMNSSYSLSKKQKTSAYTNWNSGCVAPTDSCLENPMDGGAW